MCLMISISYAYNIHISFIR